MKQHTTAVKLAVAGGSQPPANIAAAPAVAVDLSAFKLALEKTAIKRDRKQPGKRQREHASQLAAEANGLAGVQPSKPAAKKPQAAKQKRSPAANDGRVDKDSKPQPASVQDSMGAAGKAGRRERQKRSRLRKLEKKQRQTSAATEAPMQTGSDSAGADRQAAGAAAPSDATEGEEAQPHKKQKRHKLAALQAQATTHAVDGIEDDHAAPQQQPHTSTAKGSMGSASLQEHAAAKEQRPASRGKDGKAGAGLLAHMRAKLAGGRFRWLNEQLYTSLGEEAFRLMQEQPDLYEQYHEVRALACCIEVMHVPMHGPTPAASGHQTAVAWLSGLVAKPVGLRSMHARHAPCCLAVEDLATTA